MANISAELVSRQGDKYIGTPYSTVDCQALVERCLADAGLNKNLAGSNAWYRECRKNGWTGSPEECKRKFGLIPKGAFLFILKNDGGEVQRGYHDGLGNASHIGLYTGRGKGAIHSSSSRGQVCESAFSGKTIPNGGWNTVGLWKQLDYGSTVNQILKGSDNVGILDDIFGSIAQGAQQGVQQGVQQATTATDLGQPVNNPPAASEPVQTILGGNTRVVTASSGNTVNVRKKPGGEKVTALPVGATVKAVKGYTDKNGVEWTQIEYTSTGWMMAKFLKV